MRAARFSPLAALLLFTLGPGQLAASDRPVPFHEPDAVILSVTEADLERIVREALLPNGPRVEGRREHVSRGVTDLRYSAELSEPVLRLDEDGNAAVSLEILTGDLYIGRLERRVLARQAYCEGAGAVIEPGRPVDVELAFQFRVEDGDLKIVPQSVDLPNALERFRLIKPSHCGHTFLPRWLLWKLGKPHLRRYVGGLDELLLTSLRERAATLNDDDGLLTRQWRGIHVYPSSVETSGGALLVRLTASSGDATASTSAVASSVAPAAGWSGSLPARSFVGVSEPFVNEILTTALGRLSGPAHAPSGDFRRLVQSESMKSLIPGLRGLDSPGELRLSVDLLAPPRIEFTADDGGRAIVRVHVTDLELGLWGAGERLGTLAIDSATISAVPFASVLGGISFDILENDWQVSSRGIEVDEEAVAATLQELVFGELFDTRNEPVGARSLRVGRTAFEPRYFELVGNYLVMGLAGL